MSPFRAFEFTHALATVLSMSLHVHKQNTQDVFLFAISFPNFACHLRNTASVSAPRMHVIMSLTGDSKLHLF